MIVVRGFAAARKRGRPKRMLTVLALAGEERRLHCRRQKAAYGCSDASGMTLNMVRASLVLEDTGHGLVRCPQWIPKEHVKDPAKSVRGHTSCRPAVS